MKEGKVKKEERNQRLSLTLLFAGIVLLFLIAILIIFVVTIFILIRSGVLRTGDKSPNIYSILVYLALASLLIGSILAATAGRIPLKPINKIINAMNRLSRGDFRVRLSFRGAFSRHPTVREFTDSFNKMAQELENTELLRVDFIDSFSHEFKTPIVSIAGFAELLRCGELDKETEREYLAIIEKESRRLSYMATNALNLSRVEKQTILTDVTEYNLSEQLRLCVLIFEDKWNEKNIDIGVCSGEHTVKASEKLLEQVWINLIGNAVKFTPDGGSVSVDIREDAGSITVSVFNSGSRIAPENYERVFTRFYKEDVSRSTEGNGIGLSIVKKIVDLHHGSVGVHSDERGTTFTVTLPKK